MLERATHTSKTDASVRTEGTARDNGPETPLVCCIVVVTNEVHWLERCLESLLQTDYPRYMLIVVDNGSSDGSPEFVARRFPRAVLVRNRKNIGLTRAWNIGIQQALKLGGKYVAVLNPDIWFDPYWLRHLVDACERNGDIAIASPLQYNYEGTEIDEIFLPILTQAECDTHSVAKKNRVIEVTAVIGAAALIRCDLFRALGLFDNSYFVYGQETDLCRLAFLTGRKIAIVSGSKIAHWHTNRHEASMAKKVRHSRLKSRFIFTLKDPSRSILSNCSDTLRLIRRELSASRNFRYKALMCFLCVHLLARFPWILFRQARDRGKVLRAGSNRKWISPW